MGGEERNRENRAEGEVGPPRDETQDARHALGALLVGEVVAHDGGDLAGETGHLEALAVGLPVPVAARKPLWARVRVELLRQRGVVDRWQVFR